MLIGSSSRVLPGRSAVQTVYWANAKSGKFVKYGRVVSFGKNEAPKFPMAFASPAQNIAYKNRGGIYVSSRNFSQRSMFLPFQVRDFIFLI